MAIDPRLQSYLELFNRQEYWDSHEVLEDLWRETEGELRDLYQGLIQVAAALVHWQRGNRHGMDQLEQRATTRLARYRPTALGLDLDGLLAGLARCLHEGGPPPRLTRPQDVT